MTILEIKINSQKLRNFLQSKEDYLPVFTEYKSLKLLTKRKRKKLVNGLHAYITQEMTANPSHEQLVDVCHDMLEIFPLLKEPNSTVGGMVSVCVMNSVFKNAIEFVFRFDRTYTIILTQKRGSSLTNSVTKVEITMIPFN